MAAVDYYNVSKMEEDPFGEASGDSNNFQDIHRVFLDVLICIRLVLYIVMTSADIFLMYIICRNKELRTRLNMYIFNCCLLHICLYLKDPLIFIVFYLIFEIPGLYFCIEINSHTSVMSLYFAFAFLTATDWILSSYKPHLTKMLERVYVYFILALYICFGIGLAVFIALCLSGTFIVAFHTQLNIRTGIYIVILIGITILNIVRSKLTLNRDSLKTEYALTAANIIIYSFTPLLIHYYMSSLFTVHVILEYIMTYTEIILEFLGLSNPILIIYLLGRRNKHFQMAYDRCFKTSVRIYDAENLSDSEDEDVIENNANVQPTSNENNSQDTRAILVL